MAPSTREAPEPESKSLSGSLLDDVADILADVEPIAADPALGEISPKHDIFAVEKRKSWDKSTEARCNFEFRPRITPRAGLWFLSLWQKRSEEHTSELQSR